MSRAETARAETARAETARAETVRELRGRIRGMQQTRLDSRALPTNSAMRDLLPGGGLQAGSRYALPNSLSLALALLQAPSAQGAWSAVVGVPDLGAEAVAGFGIDLERLVHVPHPREHWATIVSALIDVVTIVVVAPPRVGPRLTPALVTTLDNRSRARGSVLIGLGEGWPPAHAELRITDSEWLGLGTGYGSLRARQVTVTAQSEAWAGRARQQRLWLPDPQQVVRRADAAEFDAPRRVAEPAPAETQRWRSVG